MKRAMWIPLIAAFFASCDGEPFADGRLMFRELLALRDQISKEFGEPVSDVSVSEDQRMTVKFTNSPLRSRTREEKQQRADAVGAFVATHYKRPVSAVAVQFVAEEGAETYVARKTGR